MIFIPYKLDVGLYRLPVLTILVCLICLVTFLSQQGSDDRFGDRLEAYCARGLEPNLAAILRRLNHGSDTPAACVNVFMALRNDEQPEALIITMADSARRQVFYEDPARNLAYIQGKLARGYADFEALVPRQLTADLQYNPEQHSLPRMISSSFAHGDWGHLLGNLFFFFVFASCVECALGSLHFGFSIVLMAVITSLAYSYSVASGDALPTIGLSGVAMGMMALLTTLLPRAQIWCFFWLLWYIRRFRIPVLLVALWYVGWDIYDMHNDDGSSRINYMAHVSGAFAGIALGVLYRLFAAERIERLSMAAD